MVLSYQKKLYKNEKSSQMTKNNSERYIQIIVKYFKIYYWYKKEHSSV